MSLVKSCIVAVDGGASRCRLAAFSDSGQRLARVVVESPASLTLGVNETASTVRQGLRVLASELALPWNWMPSRLSFGLAGALQDARRVEFVASWPESVETVVVTDGQAQLFGATAGSPGACLAIGTGSVLHWLDVDGRLGMAGGWGFPIGDEASGAWFGWRLIQTYLRYRDGEVVDSTLMRLLEARIGVEISDIQAWILESRSRDYAQLAPLVFEAANKGDKLADSIRGHAMDELTRLIGRAPADLPICLVGGLSEAFWPLLEARVGDRLRSAEGDALDGLWRIAIGESALADPGRDTRVER